MVLAGRVDTVPKIYKLEPRVIEAVKVIAQQQNLTESAVVNELLYKAIIFISHPK